VLLIQIRDKLSETHDAINQMHNVQQQVAEWVQRPVAQPTAAAVAEAAQGLTDKLTAIAQELIERRIQAPLDMVHYPTRLNAKLAALSSVVANADAAPTRQAYEVFQDLSARIDRQLERWCEVLATDVVSFNTLVRDSAIPAIVPRTAV
jgi:flagellar hook-associated protein FlgK